MFLNEDKYLSNPYEGFVDEMFLIHLKQCSCLSDCAYITYDTEFSHNFKNLKSDDDPK